MIVSVKVVSRLSTTSILTRTATEISETAEDVSDSRKLCSREVDDIWGKVWGYQWRK